MLAIIMPMCDICHTYYSHKPCPNCQPKQKITNAFTAEEIYSKIFLLAPSVNELDFMWAQVTKKTIQRVQSGGQVLRQGFFNIQYNDLDINLEWIGSTFSQGFYSRLEKLYPGTQSVIVINDIIAQNFNFDLLIYILNDIISVNKRSLKKFFILWLEPYRNSANQYEEYKNDIKSIINNYLINRNLNIELVEFSIPLFSTERFSKQLKQLLVNIVNLNGLIEYLGTKLPLRPLFRTQKPLLDPSSWNRVIILDLEKSSSIEPVRTVKTNLQEKIEINKCLACSSEIHSNYKVCFICKFSFCEKCINYLEKESEQENDFCLGSIYHGLHRSTFIQS